MLKLKVIKKKGKTDQLVNNMAALSRNKLEVGHFKESGSHPDSEALFVEILQGWAMGAFQAGVIKNPLAAFAPQVRSGDILNDADVKRAYRRFSKNLTRPNAAKQFLEEVGITIREEYASLFGVEGYLMPVIGSNETPLFDTGALAAATAYKSSFDNIVKEIGSI